MEELEEIIWQFVKENAAIILLIGSPLFIAFKIVVIPWLEGKKKERDRRKRE